LKKLVSIVGAGNWLISYDRIGPKVLELIQGRYGTEEVELCELGSTSLALLDHIHGQELMIVIDACLQGKSPGEITVMAPDLNNLSVEITSVHQIGPLETLAVAKRLFQEKMPEKILLVMVETKGINEKMEASTCQQVVKILDKEINRWQRDHQRSAAP
jgi:hydrogenase maturation protease